MVSRLKGAPLPQMYVGDPVPDSTSGKSRVAGGSASAGGAIGILLAAAVTHYAGPFGETVTLAILTLTTMAGAGLAGAGGAYWQRNFLK